MERHKCRTNRLNISISRTDLRPGNHDDHGDHEEIGGCMRKLQSEFLVASCRTYWDSYFLSVQKILSLTLTGRKCKTITENFLVGSKICKVAWMEKLFKSFNIIKVIKSLFLHFFSSFPPCGWLWNIWLKLGEEQIRHMSTSCQSDLSGETSFSDFTPFQF